jgi:hypothetical protein
MATNVSKTGWSRATRVEVPGIGVWITQTSVAAIASTVLLFQGVSLSRADQTVPPAIANTMQSGMVTEVREHTIVVNGREYGFSPKVVVLDQKGREAELSYITRNSEVNFHVMKDDIQKIERLIVRHPE